jgi:hypothetical protein
MTARDHIFLAIISTLASGGALVMFLVAINAVGFNG